MATSKEITILEKIIIIITAVSLATSSWIYLNQDVRLIEELKNKSGAHTNSQIHETPDYR